MSSKNLKYKMSGYQVYGKTSDVPDVKSVQMHLLLEGMSDLGHDITKFLKYLRDWPDGRHLLQVWQYRGILYMDKEI